MIFGGRGGGGRGRQHEWVRVLPSAESDEEDFDKCVDECVQSYVCYSNCVINSSCNGFGWTSWYHMILRYSNHIIPMIFIIWYMSSLYQYHITRLIIFILSSSSIIHIHNSYSSSMRWIKIISPLCRNLVLSAIVKEERKTWLPFVSERNTLDTLESHFRPPPSSCCCFFSSCFCLLWMALTIKSASLCRARISLGRLNDDFRSIVITVQCTCTCGCPCQYQCQSRG